MKLTAVRLREEHRAWAGASLLGTETRRTWIVTLHTDTGARAEGEVAWLPRFGEEGDVQALVACWAWGWLGRELPDAEVPTGLPAPVAWAITGALADLQDRWTVPEDIVENGLLAATDGTPREVAAAWSATIASQPGVGTYKVKVGRADLQTDLARLRALDLPDGVQLRLDPNRGWGAHDPNAIRTALHGLPIEYIEEPVAWPDLATWASSGLPCAADESVLEVDIDTLARAGLAAVVLKPSVLGGLGSVLARIRDAEAQGMQVVLSSSLEGPVGRRHLEALTSELSVPRAAAGLARDVLVEPPVSVDAVASWSVGSDPLSEAAERFGDAVAFDTPSGGMTFGEWHAAAWTEARRLGDQTGARIALDITGPTGAVQLFAILRSGATACLVPPGVQREGAAAQVGAVEPRAGTGEPPGITLGGPATMLWSSGSQGRPRAIAHSLGQHLSSAMASHLHTPFGVRDRWLASLRMHHVGGLALLFRALVAGGTVVFPGERPLSELRATHLSWVPTQLMRADPSPPDSLKFLLLGGAAAPPALVSGRRERGWPVQTTYGSTECASQVCTSTITADPSHSGAPLAGRVVEALPSIRVRGTTVCLGQWEDGALQPLTDADGWLITGDFGHITDDGTLRVRGRADTMFISGGENVFPESIERVVGAHPAVRQVVVVDVPDDEWGARPWAFVDGELDEGEARQLMAEHLPRFAWVDRFVPWDEDGVGATGKPRRGWFRARAHELKRRGSSAPE